MTTWSTGQVLACCLVGVLSGFGGVLLGGSRADSRVLLERPSSPEVEEGTGALQALADQVQQMRNQLDGLAMNGSERRPVGAPGVDINALDRAIDKLQTLASDWEIRRQDSGPRGVVKNRPVELRWVDLPSAKQLPYDDLETAFKWLTYEEVLERLGPPDVIDRSEHGLRWRYGQDGWEVAIEFVDGHAVRAWN